MNTGYRIILDLQTNQLTQENSGAIFSLSGNTGGSFQGLNISRQAIPILILVLVNDLPRDEVVSMVSWEDRYGRLLSWLCSYDSDFKRLSAVIER